MKIVLEREDVRFATTICEPLGNIRWLVVKVGSKKFNVYRTLDPHYYGISQIEEEIDRVLLREMEHILAKMFRASVEAVPDGPLDIN